MKKKLTLELTPMQYQQLLETLFIGSIRLDYDEMYSLLKAGHTRLLRDVLKKAPDFGKENLIQVIGNDYSISRELEERVMPYMFDDGDDFYFFDEEE